MRASPSPGSVIPRERALPRRGPQTNSWLRDTQEDSPERQELLRDGVVLLHRASAAGPAVADWPPDRLALLGSVWLPALQTTLFPLPPSPPPPCHLPSLLAASGAVSVVEFLVSGLELPVDGHCSRKRLKAATRAQRCLRQSGKDGPRPAAPLHSAASGGSLEGVAALLRLRANVTATEAHGVMPLHLAASRGPADSVELLLNAGAPLAAKDLNLQTPIHFAARSGSVGTLALLLGRWLADDAICSQGARVYGGPLDWRDRWHRTPVHWATLNDHTDALSSLLEATIPYYNINILHFDYAIIYNALQYSIITYYTSSRHKGSVVGHRFARPTTAPLWIVF